MHSYLLYQPHGNRAIIQNKVMDMFELSLGQYSFYTHPDIRHLSPKGIGHEQPFLLPTSQTIKIDQVRALKLQLLSQPIALPVQLFLIWQAETMTIPSQHALLKMLEEPGEHNRFLLITTNPYTMLHTIQSRCEMVLLPSPSTTPHADSIETIVQSLKYENIGQRFQALEEHTKDKEQTLITLMQLLHFYTRTTVHTPSSENKKKLQLIDTALQRLHHNANLRMTLDVLALTW